MNKKIIILLTSIFLFAFAIYPALAAGNASLNLSPTSGSYEVGETFSVFIVVLPNGETIDMVRARVNFPSDILEVQSFSFGSIYSHLSGGNSYDNSAGTLSQGAGHIGGTNQNGTFGTIVFKAKSVGRAAVTISSYSLMLSVGVNKFDGNAKSASYNLTDPIIEPDPILDPDLPDEKAENEKENNNEESKAEDEDENEKTEEENSESRDGSRPIPTVEISGETYNAEENSSNDLSEKSWHIITIFVAVLFGLAGYWHGRQSRPMRRRF